MVLLLVILTVTLNGCHEDGDAKTNTPPTPSPTPEVTQTPEPTDTPAPTATLSRVLT